jgi:GNAT superfamily N-acetyltransferase
MEKTVTLKDGRDVVIREMRPEDAEKSFEFFRVVPPEDRRYLRTDVTRWETITQRVEEMQRGRIRTLVALDSGAIVADAGLELAGHGWGEGVAEIRLIVARSHQRLGLGQHMAHEVYLLAYEHDIERIVVRMMRPQEGAHQIFHNLGFHEEFIIPSHVKDREGNWQDLIIMRSDLKRQWSEMEELQTEMDWQRHR